MGKITGLLSGVVEMRELDHSGILSFSGGGVRGLFQAEFMKLLLQNYSSDNLFKRIRLIAGTSTGSIIAAGLAFEISPDDIVRLFDHNAKEIFTPKHFKYIRKGGRYSNVALRRALKAALGNKTLGESKHPIKLCATCLTNHTARVFCSERVTDKNLPIVDAVMASCAAPTYFPSVKVGSRDYIDGGLWANAPALAAIVDMEDIKKIDLSKLWVLHVGNGKQPNNTTKEKYEKLLSLGPGIMSVIFDLMFNTQEALGIEACRKLLGNSRLLEINPLLKTQIAIEDWSTAQKILKGAAESEHNIHMNSIHNLIKFGVKGYDADDEDGVDRFAHDPNIPRNPEDEIY